MTGSPLGRRPAAATACRQAVGRLQFGMVSREPSIVSPDTPSSGTMTDTVLPDLGLLQKLQGGGGMGPVDLLAACLARIAELNTATNAVIALDRIGAERAAEESAGYWRRGAPRSTIDGAPILVKANFSVAGLPWHGGIAAYRDRTADIDAPAVRRLRQAGAIILGLTNMDEGALGAAGENAWLGRIGNPHHPKLSAGGSSGGSAAAVAAGFCMAALGSDTIGSIAIPAAYCGVVGHRASRHLMPMAGVMPLSPTFDHGGWHTRSTGGALALRKAIGGVLGQDGPFHIAAIEPEQTPVMLATARARSAGWRVDDIATPVALGDIGRRLFEVAEVEAAHVHAQALRDAPDGFSPLFRKMLGWGAGKGRDRYDANLVLLNQAADTVLATLAGYDALLMPATPHAGYPAGSSPPPDQAVFAALVACLGWPATTVPARDSRELAVLVTARTDDICLAIAARL